jgi:hypothetical protein
MLLLLIAGGAATTLTPAQTADLAAFEGCSGPG